MTAEEDATEAVETFSCGGRRGGGGSSPSFFVTVTQCMTCLSAGGMRLNEDVE